MPENTKLVMDCSDPSAPPQEVPLTTEEEAHRVAGAQADARRGAARALEGSEDDERLGLIAERAQIDPAFAALADLALRGRA